MAELTDADLKGSRFRRVDLSGARPSLDELLPLRQQRLSRVADFLRDASPDDLALSVNLDVGDIEALVAQPVDADSAATRVLELLDRFNRHVHAEQVQYRTAMRLYQDQWLDAAGQGETEPLVREGRRGRWLEASLAPLAGTVPAADLQRLIRALSLVMGTEAMVTLRDVCHLDTDDAMAVTDWVARVLLEATFGEVPASADGGG